MITQLRDVRAAGESAEVAVKDHQEPLPPVIFEPVRGPPAVAEIESNGGFSCQLMQIGLLPKGSFGEKHRVKAPQGGAPPGVDINVPEIDN